MYAYAANNPVRYIDPDGQFIKEVKQFGSFLKDGFSRWGTAAMNPEDINSLNRVTDFMNENPSFWGALGATGALVAVGFSSYKNSEKMKNFIDEAIYLAYSINRDLLNIGIDIQKRTYNYNQDTGFCLVFDFSKTFFADSGFDLASDSVIKMPFNNSTSLVTKLNEFLYISFSSPLQESELKGFELSISISHKF